MKKKLNLQYLFSYFGLIPYFFILINNYFLLQIEQEIILNFSIYYTLLIFVFIGSINWSFEYRVSNFIAFYGFLPSFLSVIIIILNLSNFDFKTIIVIIIIILFLQLILDYIIIYYNKNFKNYFYYLRLPLTLIICFSLSLLIV